MVNLNNKETTNERPQQYPNRGKPCAGTAIQDDIQGNAPLHLSDCDEPFLQTERRHGKGSQLLQHRGMGETCGYLQQPREERAGCPDSGPSETGPLE